MIYFTADTHFNHRNIINFCQRPFGVDEVDEMNACILDAINAKVQQKDELWHLGDFGLHLKDEDVKKFLARIHCKNVRLIFGNHDSHQAGHQFQHVYQAHVIKWNHQSFYLSHYPLRSWREHFQLHGHEHGTMPPLAGQLDVGVDGQLMNGRVDGRNFGGERQRKEPFGTPWSIEEVIEHVQRRDKDRLVRDACKQRYGDRLIVGGYTQRDRDDADASV